MNSAIVISPRVINTINSLPSSERTAIASALAAEMLLGASAAATLTPMQQMLYAMIRQYVERDSRRLNSAN